MGAPDRRVAPIVVVLALTLPFLSASDHPAAPACAPGGSVTYDDELSRDDAQTYSLLPFEVTDEVTAVEVSYEYGSDGPETEVMRTVVDLGLWDQAGPYDAAGFRGWSGSRHEEVHVAADSAERGYLARRVEAGTWHVELGIATVHRQGGWYEVTISCSDEEVGESPSGSAGAPDPVDPDHVASTEAGWFHGDLHMHAYHSAPDAPEWGDLVAFAREQQLDFLPITEYVTTAHWYELGAVQRDHPDLLIWPGREIITYHGHAIALGETWDHVEYRHGLEAITMADIQRETVAAGALFQVAHPTTFEEPIFEDFCRGCAWDLEEYTDWDAVHTIEVLTGPAVVHPGGDQDLAGFENPYMRRAIEMWEDLLNAGHGITAVGGSDDKWAGTEQNEYGTISPHGVPATAVYAEELSRAGLTEALRVGRAYVRSLGVAESPALEMEAVAPGGLRGTFGSELDAEEAELTVTVRGGGGQLLVLIRNGDEEAVVPIVGDDFSHTLTIDRDPGGEGPLGTWWRVETRDPATGPPMVATTVGNPLYLVSDADPPPPDAPPDETPSGPGSAPDETRTHPTPEADRGPLPATGGGDTWFVGWMMLTVVVSVALRGRTARMHR
jgi:hypothetical protein